jgi:molybdate transport system substrate-binding protein
LRECSNACVSLFSVDFFMNAMLSVATQDKSLSAPPVLTAAGSLVPAMNELILAYAAKGGLRFVAQYGPSGKLRQEIEAGMRVDVFASASADHTEALAQKQLLGESRIFAHNDLCVVSRPELALSESNLLDVLLRKDVRLGTATPVDDPMGDYTWQFFRNAESKRPGSYQTFDAKALKLSGASVPAPGAKSPYVAAFEESRVDAYIMYCTNAVSTGKTLPQLSIAAIPQGLSVRGAYGIAARTDSVEGARLVEFVLSQSGQDILRNHGFR